MTSSPEYLELYEYRLRVAAAYDQRNSALLAGEDPTQVWRRFRNQRGELFATHPQSPLEGEDRDGFTGLEYFPYDEAAVAIAETQPAETHELIVDLGHEGTVTLKAAARLTFQLFGNQACLTAFWIDAYGGGLFVPFRDETSKAQTYGGGRYLVDTLKGTGFGMPPGGGTTVRLDFNYAYNPSCAYSSRWVCPLSPAENRFEFAVAAGEKRFHR